MQGRFVLEETGRSWRCLGHRDLIRDIRLSSRTGLIRRETLGPIAALRFRTIIGEDRIFMQGNFLTTPEKGYR
jgi:hypothetical protein